MPIAEFGDPEETIIQDMYDHGVRAWTSNNLDDAFAKRASIFAAEGLFPTSVTDHGALTGLTDDDHTQYLKETDVAAKGDLYAASANDTVGVLSVGADGQVLTADSSQTLGVKWGTASSGATDHAHVVDEVFNGDGATTTFDLANSADPESAIAYVAGTRTQVTVGGSLNDQITFAVAPGAGTNNVSVDYVAPTS
jgi:hypothetical protein